MKRVKLDISNIINDASKSESDSSVVMSETRRLQRTPDMVQSIISPRIIKRDLTILDMSSSVESDGTIELLSSNDELIEDNLTKKIKKRLKKEMSKIENKIENRIREEVRKELDNLIMKDVEKIVRDIVDGIIIELDKKV